MSKAGFVSGEASLLELQMLPVAVPSEMNLWCFLLSYNYSSPLGPEADLFDLI